MHFAVVVYLKQREVCPGDDERTDEPTTAPRAEAVVETLTRSLVELQAAVAGMVDRMGDTPAPARAGSYLKDRNICARFGGINPSTLWRWRKTRGFPAGIRVGRDRMVSLADIETWESAQRAAALAEAAV